MNYNELSDFEINKRVAYLVDGIKKVVCTASTSGYGSVNVKNYCNNPADAWPIIVENHITLQAYATEYSAYPLSDRDILATNKNPLRAAMIVFLMMREENGRV